MMFEGKETSALTIAKSILEVAVSLASEENNVEDALRVMLRKGGTKKQLEAIQRHVNILRDRLLLKLL